MTEDFSKKEELNNAPETIKENFSSTGFYKRNQQYEVTSSNIKSIGLYDTFRFNDQKVLSLKVIFLRGGIYVYWPITEEEFLRAFSKDVLLKDWFNDIKLKTEFTRLL